jgi:hypothetical protein
MARAEGVVELAEHRLELGPRVVGPLRRRSEGAERPQVGEPPPQALGEDVLLERSHRKLGGLVAVEQEPVEAEREESLLALHVVVEGPLRDAHLGRDVGHLGGPEPLGREQPQGGRDQLVEPLLGRLPRHGGIQY